MKLRSLSIALALAGVAAISTAAYADDTHNSGFFAGVGAGYNDPQLPGGTPSLTDDAGNSGTVTYSTDKYMASVYGGYLFNFAFNFDLGPMLSFNYFGPMKATATDGTGSENIHTYNFSLQAVGQYTWQSFFARINAGEGYFMMRNSTSGGTSSDVASSDNLWKPLAGLSLGYYFTPAVNVSLFYLHVFGSTVGNTEVLPRMNSLGLNVEYAFGGMGIGSDSTSST